MILKIGNAKVPLYDFHEARVCFYQPIDDPFRTVIVRASVVEPDGTQRSLGGFCDAQDGSVFCVRFLATTVGDYTYKVSVEHDGEVTNFEGAFSAIPSNSPGMLRVSSQFPYHFEWSNGTPFFWNATTTYLMAGGTDDAIATAIQRLASKKVNRIRVALSPSRNKDGGRWYEEQVKPREDFTYLYSPWRCTRPESVTDPEWDVTRFDVPYWQKFERLLAKAKAENIIVSVIFYLDGADKQNYPFDRSLVGGNPDEYRYYAYAVARLAAFSNVEWCITNEWDLFRPDEWTDELGAYLATCDPYHHLTSVHGHGHFPFRTSPWADFAMFQIWDEAGGYEPMHKRRLEQAATGRPIPQINEEYGYEDTYPQGWGGAKVAPSRNADSRRRIAWQITMAGCYQTTGESAENGLGGWINGFGDDSMTLLDSHRLLYEFFTGFEWRRLDPHPEIANGGMCLADLGSRYLLYLPQGGEAKLQVVQGAYQAEWYNPRAGASHPVTEALQTELIQLMAPDSNDWLLHLWR